MIIADNTCTANLGCNECRLFNPHLFIYVCSQIIRQRLLVSSTQLITWICGFMISQLVNLVGWLLEWLAKCSAVTIVLDTIQNFEYMWISNSFGSAVEHSLKKEGVVELIVMVFLSTLKLAVRLPILAGSC